MSFMGNQQMTKPQITVTELLMEKADCIETSIPCREEKEGSFDKVANAVTLCPALSSLAGSGNSYAGHIFPAVSFDALEAC